LCETIIFKQEVAIILQHNAFLVYLILTVADPIKLFFFEFLRFFAAKLVHFTISDFFLYVTKHSKINSENQKTKKKSFIGLATESFLFFIFFL